MKRSSHPATVAVHAGDRKPPAEFRPVTTPIFSASSFFYETLEELEQVFADEKEGHTYSRYGNPTARGLEEQVAALEGADFAVATSSGMAAVHLSLLAALLDRRQAIVAANVLYGQTLSLLTRVLEPAGVEVRFADPCDVGAFGQAIAETNPSVVLLETISNPLLRVPPLDRIAALAKSHGALTLVDSTFTTPVLMRPLELGADLVVHSATKYLGGHGDVLGGVLLGRNELHPPVRFLERTLGANLGAFEAYLAMRGVKTLPLRMERQCRNAAEAAARLAGQPGVERVYYPGDPQHPDHDTAKRLFAGGLFGAMVSVDLEGGRERAAAFMNSLRLTVPATSLGDVHTMALYPPTSSHRDLAPAHRRRLGIGDGLVRLSIGIEHIDDIVADLEQALVASQPAAVHSAT